MEMKNIKFIIAGICLFPFSLKAQSGFVVHGKIGTETVPAVVYLHYSNEGKSALDSAKVEKGQFSFNGKVSNPVAATLSIKYKVRGAGPIVAGDETPFYLENSDITITAKDSLWTAAVKGSKTYDDDFALRIIQRPYRKIADSVTKIYYGWTNEQRKDTVLAKSLLPAIKRSQVGYDSVTRVFIASHPNSFISLQVFAYLELGYNFDPDTAAARFSRLSASLRESFPGTSIAALIETGRKTNIGVNATDFTQNDSTGKPVKLSDFRGKYVLVDFWASWCHPCRAENPNLLKAYDKYKNKNFTILGVSIDDVNGRKAWLHAVAQDGMPWTQVSELKGANSQAALAYGITAIPANFLISPDGKIVAKNLRGDGLEKKLAEILKM